MKRDSARARPQDRMQNLDFVLTASLRGPRNPGLERPWPPRRTALAALATPLLAAVLAAMPARPASAQDEAIEEVTDTSSRRRRRDVESNRPNTTTVAESCRKLGTNGAV